MRAQLDAARRQPGGLLSAGAGGGARGAWSPGALSDSREGGGARAARGASARGGGARERSWGPSRRSLRSRGAWSPGALRPQRIGQQGAARGAPGARERCLGPEPARGACAAGSSGVGSSAEGRRGTLVDGRFQSLRAQVQKESSMMMKGKLT